MAHQDNDRENATEESGKAPKYTPHQKTLDQVENNFMYHSPQSDQPERYVELREKGKELAMMILAHTPPSREQAIALTKLEECVMFANAAIARNEG